MPAYLLSCNSCKKEFEATFSVKAPLPHCPHCSSVDTRRLIASAATVILKGDCWSSDGFTYKKDIY
jgi:putative FmdB family regulatory protein